MIINNSNLKDIMKMLKVGNRETQYGICSKKEKIRFKC